MQGFVPSMKRYTSLCLFNSERAIHLACSNICFFYFTFTLSELLEKNDYDTIVRSNTQMCTGCSVFYIQDMRAHDTRTQPMISMIVIIYRKLLYIQMYTTWSLGQRAWPPRSIDCSIRY